MRYRSGWRLPALAFAAALAGCADLLPQPGEPVALQVFERLTPERMRHGRQIDVGSALAQGVSEAAIAAGRLAVLICAAPGEAQDPEAKWVVLLPESMTLRDGDVVAFRPGTRYGREGAPGTVTGRLPQPPPEALYVWKHGKSVRCGAPAADGTLQGRYGFAFGRQDLAEYRRHRERMRGVSEEEVRAGRIVRASCSRLTDGWTEWTVRVPPGLDVAKGDHILARAGTPDDEPGSAIAEAIRKIPAPGADRTYYVQGSRIIRCDAAGAGQ